MSRHSSKTIALARRMAEDDWTAPQISRVLARQGITVHRDTVRCWIDPEYNERHLKNSRLSNRRSRKGRGPAAKSHAQRLREHGLSFNAISVVLGVYHQYEITGEGVRQWFRNDREAARAASSV